MDVIREVVMDAEEVDCLVKIAEMILQCSSYHWSLIALQVKEQYEKFVHQMHVVEGFRVRTYFYGYFANFLYYFI